MADRFSLWCRTAPRTLPILVLLTLCGPSAVGRTEAPTPILRSVLALIDSDGQDWTADGEDYVQQIYEMPLNYLGLTVIRHDIREGPPPEDYLTNLRAVLTCFRFTKRPADWVMPWLEKIRARGGIRFLHMGGFGPMALGENGEGPKGLARWLSAFGLGYDDAYVDLPLGVTATLRDKKLCALEADPRRATVHLGPYITGDGNVPWVTTRCPSSDIRARAPVVTGPWGGIALQPWVFKDDGGEGTRRLYLDLFAFFAEALDLKGLPAPQPSVLNGRRMYFCHVDGDGFESISTVETGKLCGEVFLSRIVERFDLPITISIIVASLADSIEPDEPTREMRAAAVLLSHPKVEPATHTVLHPFSWQVKPGEPFPVSSGFPSLEGYQPSPEAEVRASLRFIDRYLLGDRQKCRMVLWSGDATPPEAAVEEARRLGALNLNGGIYRYDDLYDSVAYVPPFGRRLARSVQAYCGAPNENIFEGYFTRQPGTFAHVDETIERTGKGRILKPANVYVHFYSVERPQRLEVFERLLHRWGEKEETAPVFTSTYAAAVESALETARVLRIPDGWVFSDFGACRTVRIDGETRPIAWDRSPGILGTRTMGGALYLALARGDAEVVFDPAAKPQPYLEQANHVLTDAERSASGVTATSQSFARRVLVFAGFPAGSEVVLRIDDATERKNADDTGRLRVDLPPGRSRIEVRRP